MRVKIETQEKTTGFLRKKTHYEIVCKVEFTEEEKAIIKKHDLGDRVLWQGSKPIVINGNEYPPIRVRLKDFMQKKPYTCNSPTPAEAKGSVAHLEERMTEVKAFLNESASLGQTKRTLDL